MRNAVQNLRGWRAAVAAGLVACVGGCGSRQVMAPTTTAIVATAPAVTSAASAEFPAAAGILAGFDLAATPGEWNIGDRVLLLLRTEKKGVVTNRFLLVELGDKLDVLDTLQMSAKSSRGPVDLSSPTVTTRLRVFDADGKLLEEAEGKFPSDLLGYGLTDGAGPYLGRPLNDPAVAEDLSEDEFKRMMRGWMTLFAFSGSLNKKGLFSEMLQDVVARPSLLRLVFNRSAGIKLGDPGPTTGAPWTPRGDSGAVFETVEVPLELSIAGKRSMSGKVTATKAVAPLSLCGGVLTAHAANADDPTTRLEIRLLGAARGTGGQAFQADERMLRRLKSDEP